jgi:flagellar hook-associated protein 1
MPGLFSTFNVAKRGMFVQQKSIDVTSHNIANANTAGYSRQRAVIETTRPYGMPSLNTAAEPGQLGTGAQISTIQRIRDSFLDYQVRIETSTLGQFESREKFLNEIESIFNEPSDTGISTLIGKFFDSWHELSKQPQSSNARTVVAQQSQAMADELNHTYNQLEKLKKNAQSSINHTVFEVNSMLSQVSDLNQQIKQVKIAGNMPNDLMDKRDLLIDQLSSKFNLDIEKQNFDGINLSAGDTSGITSSNLVNAIINGSERKFSYISSIKRSDESKNFPTDCTITYYKLGDTSSSANEVTITLKNLTEEQYRQIDENRVLWADSKGVAIKDDGTPLDGSYSKDISFSDINLFETSDGELKGFMSIQKDINDYMSELNKLAKALAFTVNAVHSGKDDASADKLPFFINSSDPTKEEEITAGNIAVNSEIIKDVMKIKTKTNDDKYDYTNLNTEDGEADGARAQAMAGLRDVFVKIQDINVTINSRKDLFTTGGNELTNHGMTITNNINGMKVDSYFKDTIDRLGVQGQEAQRIVKNQEALLNSFEESRLSVSGVSLDEEMANLVQFQHAYNANAKLISTIDELLDVVVNGLKR